MSVTAAMARRFFMPLAMLCGADAIVGYPISRQTAATLATPAINLSLMSSSDVKDLWAEHGALVVDL